VANTAEDEYGEHFEGLLPSFAMALTAPSSDGDDRSGRDGVRDGAEHDMAVAGQSIQELEAGMGVCAASTTSGSRRSARIPPRFIVVVHSVLSAGSSGSASAGRTFEA
jgi:hypothetical protein